jgi:hypothetical protein
MEAQRGPEPANERVSPFMTIEIRQMRVTSTVMQRTESEPTDPYLSEDRQETLKTEILESCRQLVVDMLRERQER